MSLLEANSLENNASSDEEEEDEDAKVFIFNNFFNFILKIYIS